MTDRVYPNCHGKNPVWRACFTGCAPGKNVGTLFGTVLMPYPGEPCSGYPVHNRVEGTRTVPLPLEDRAARPHIEEVAMSTVSFSVAEDPGAATEVDPDPLISCRSCGGSLELSQPDSERPEALLGTCGRCGGWHRVEVRSLVAVAPRKA
jgi:hypothetical protein